jgi:hypothetical protein
MCDTLVSPLNDSFLDLDVLATVDPVTFAVTEVSQYAEMVCDARRQRRSADGCIKRLGSGPQSPLVAWHVRQAARLPDP